MERGFVKWLEIEPLLVLTAMLAIMYGVGTYYAMTREERAMRRSMLVEARHANAGLSRKCGVEATYSSAYLDTPLKYTLPYPVIIASFNTPGGLTVHLDIFSDVYRVRIGYTDLTRERYECVMIELNKLSTSDEVGYIVDNYTFDQTCTLVMPS